MSNEYPKWVCKDCAKKAGGSVPEGHIISVHMAICPCCGHLREVNEPRDYRYPKGLKVLYEYMRATQFMEHPHK